MLWYKTHDKMYNRSGGEAEAPKIGKMMLQLEWKAKKD